MDSAALKKAIVAAARPDLSLDGKDATYIDTAFDLISTDLKKADSQTQQNRKDSSENSESGKSADKRDSLGDAQAKYRERMLKRA